MEKKTNSRRAAAFVVLRWLATKDFPANLLPEGPDRAFVQDLVYTVIRRLRPLRRVLGELVRKWPKGELEALLYVGAAQVLYMDEVPDYAAVNETVEAAKACPNRNVAKVVNGVLHNLIRRRAEFEATIAAAPLEERESFPTELVRRWTARFGADDAAKLCAWHNEPAETFIARKDGTFVALERGRKVTDVPGYAEGEFIVQDPATALAVELMGVKPGDKILDACAAPGGKTVQLAWRGAAVTACEVNPKRRRTLEANLARLKLSVDVIGSLESLVGSLGSEVGSLGSEVGSLGSEAGSLEAARTTDAVIASEISQSDNQSITQSPNHPIPQSPNPPITQSPNRPIAQSPNHPILQFSKVLVDAPCSNTGVLRRRPDARWNWSGEKLAALVKLQAEIMDQVVPLVPSGGTLVYSTCSNEPEENLGQVEAFLARHPDFALVESRESVPYETGHDGAFAAKLVRRG